MFLIASSADTDGGGGKEGGRQGWVEGGKESFFWPRRNRSFSAWSDGQSGPFLSEVDLPPPSAGERKKRTSSPPPGSSPQAATTRTLLTRTHTPGEGAEGVLRVCRMLEAGEQGRAGGRKEGRKERREGKGKARNRTSLSTSSTAHANRGRLPSLPLTRNARAAKLKRIQCSQKGQALNKQCQIKANTSDIYLVAVIYSTAFFINNFFGQKQCLKIWL